MTTFAVGGPPAAGKTTTAGCLGAALGLPVVSFDAGREHRYRPWGYTAARAEWHYRSGGARALHRYESLFELRALEEAVRKPESRVLDLGGGILLQHSPEARARLETALASVELVLVLPEPSDHRACLVTLTARVSGRGDRPDSVAWLRNGGESIMREVLDATLQRVRQGRPLICTSTAGDLETGVAAAVAGHRHRTGIDAGGRPG
jgi:shikimate kinase